VGDYVDRGPDSARVVETLMRLERERGTDEVVCLMGNHEDMLLIGEYTYAAETILSYVNHPDREEGEPLPKDVVSWMRCLRRYYEDEQIVVAHAGIDPRQPLTPAQSDTWLLWYRYERGQRADIGRYLYHGHTPRREIERAQDRCNVDTACVFGGDLTAAVVGPTGAPIDFIQVPGPKERTVVPL
jgi:serine/threonine protein phosphatase 1